MAIKHGWLTDLSEKVYAISHAAVIIYKDTTVQAVLEKLESQSGSGGSTGNIDIPLLTNLTEINCTNDSLLSNIVTNMPQNTLLFTELSSGALLTEIQEGTSSNQGGTLLVISNVTQKQFIFLSNDSKIYLCTYVNDAFTNWTNIGEINYSDIDVSKIPFPAPTEFGTETLKDTINKMIQLIYVNKQKPILRFITLSASNWVGDTAPFTYTVPEIGIAENSIITIIPRPTISKEQLDSFIFGNIIGTSQTQNQFVLSAFGDKPLIDIPLQILIQYDGYDITYSSVTDEGDGISTHSSYFEFELNTDGNSYTVKNLTLEGQNLKTIRIPSTYKGKPVTEISSGLVETVNINNKNMSKSYRFATHSCNSKYYDTLDDIKNEFLKEIIIPESITKIGYEAFYNCIALEKVSILGNGLTTIGNNSFHGCTSLTYYNLPTSITAIGNYAFSNCASLNTAIFASSNTNYDNGIYENCTGLKNIDFSNCPTILPSMIFNGCTGFEALNLPSNIQEIKGGVFQGCTNLEITVPNSVTAIGDFAFNNVKHVFYSGSATGSPWGAIKVN